MNRINNTLLHIKPFFDDAKVFHLEQKILLPLSLSDAKERLFLKLPYNSIFVDVVIPYGGGVFLGILLWEHELGISVFSIHAKSEENASYVCGSLTWYDEPENPFEKKIEGELEEHHLKYLIKVAKNFIHLMHTKDVEIVDNSHLRNNNKPSKGLNYPHCFVRISQTLRVYIEKIDQNESFTYSHRFWVRGHFRELRNQEFFGDNTGKRIWIKPYLKGEGILIEKAYQLEEPSNSS